MKKTLLLIALLFPLILFAESYLPGLRCNWYAGSNFEHHFKSETIKDGVLPLYRETIPWPESVPGHARRGLSQFTFGFLEIPEDGTYTVRGGGKGFGLLSLNGIERPLEQGVTLKLSKGLVSLAIYRTKFDGQVVLEWRLPDSAKFEAIPAKALSHTLSQESRTAMVIPQIPFKEIRANAYSLIYEVDVPESGFYCLRIRRTGEMAWDCQGMSVWLDGVERRKFYDVDSTNATGGFFGDFALPLYWKAGKHRVEFKGVTRKWAARAPRFWLEKTNLEYDSDKTLVVSEKLPGESVFRMGQPIEWIAEAATLDGERKILIKVNRQRQEDRELWTGEIVLPGGKKYVRGSVPFPECLAGAFEYRIYDGTTGELLEGPWEFLVIDPTPLPVKRLTPFTDNSALAGGVLVDTVDCSKETHRFRDNGTSSVKKAGKISYRQTGGPGHYKKYYNVGFLKPDPKMGDPIPCTGKEPKEKKLPGRPVTVFTTNWFAYTPEVKNPGRAHIAIFYIPNDQYRRIPVQIFDHTTTEYNAGALEVQPAPIPGLVKIMVPFWPNERKVDILTYPSTSQRGTATESAIAKIEIYEFPEGLPPMPEAACGWNPERFVGWTGEQADLGPESATMPRLWEDGHRAPQIRKKSLLDYTAYAQVWSRFGEYSRWRGDNYLIWPIHSYLMAHVKTDWLPIGNDLFASGTKIDKFSRNTLKIIALCCEKYGVDFIGDLQINHFKEDEFLELAAQLENATPEEMRGFILKDGLMRQGKNLNPANPKAREYLKHFYGAISKVCAGCSGFKGINLRQLNWSSAMSAWFHHFTVGYDDYTIEVFEKETGIKVPSGDKPDDPKAVYKARYDFLVNNEENRKIWFKWRADKVVSLREEILEEVRKYNPKMNLTAFGANVSIELGAGLDEERLGHRKDLGFGFKKASCEVAGIELNALDPFCFKNFDVRTDVKQFTIAEKFAAIPWSLCYPNGATTADGLSMMPFTTRKLAEALAENPLDIVFSGCFWRLPPTIPELRDWFQTWRAIPSIEYKKVPTPPDFPAVAWQGGKDGKFIVYIVSLCDSEREFQLDTKTPIQKFTDMVTGAEVVTDGKGFSVKVAPFGLRLCELDSEVVSVCSSSEKNATVSRKSEKWEKPSATKRLTLSVKNKGAQAREDSLGILHGYQLSRVGAKRCDTLALYRNGKKIPIQVDPKDAEGRYLKETNTDIGEYDEICFRIPFKAGEKSASLNLYLDGDPESYVNPFKIQSQPKPQPDKAWTLEISDGKFAVGFMNGAIGELREGPTRVFSARAIHLHAPGWNHAYDVLLPVPFFPLEMRPLRTGPVRAVVGAETTKKVDFAPTFGKNGNPFFIRHWSEGFLKGMQMERRYQIIAGVSEVSALTRFRYERALLPTFNYATGYCHSYFTPYPRDPQNMVLYFPKNGKLVTDGYDPEKKSIIGSGGLPWAFLWNTKYKCGFAIAVAAGEASIQAGKVLMLHFGCEKIPPHQLDVPVWLRCPDTDDPQAIDLWSRQVRSGNPVVDIISVEQK